MLELSQVKSKKYQMECAEKFKIWRTLATKSDFNLAAFCEYKQVKYCIRGHSKYRQIIVSKIIGGFEPSKDDLVEFNNFNESEADSLLSKLRKVSKTQDPYKYGHVAEKLKKLDFLRVFGCDTFDELCKTYNLTLLRYGEDPYSFNRKMSELPLDISVISTFLSNPNNRDYISKCLNLKPTYLTILNTMALPLKKKESFLNTLLKTVVSESEFPDELKERERIINERLAKRARSDERKLQDEQAYQTFVSQLNEMKLNTNITYPQIVQLVQNKYLTRFFDRTDITDVFLFEYFDIDLSKEKKQYIKEAEQVAALLQKYGSGGLIHNMYVSKILNISETELKRWKSDGRLEISESREFRKWGKTLSSDYYSPKFLLSITPETITKWRLLDKPTTLSNQNFIDKLAECITKARASNFVYIADIWYSLETLKITECDIKTLLPLQNIKPIKNNSRVETVIQNLNAKRALLDLNAEASLILTKLEKKVLSETQLKAILNKLSIQTKDLSITAFTPGTLDVFLKKEILAHKISLDKISLMEQLKLNEYAHGFPIARNLSRQIHIITGPTNSGKTYDALETLKSVSSGVYLAPLRLLAMEIYDKLNAEGIPCNLITGEERIMIPGAKHTASTVEMLNINNEVDVAVIDEFQMVGDSQRGWAWSAALIGVPAKTVVVLGNAQYLNMLTELFDSLHESYTVTQKSRYAELKLIKDLMPIKDLCSGDAVVAFSRKDVLAYATRLRDLKYKVSIIYGSLSPEIRRKQAELFNSGKTDIVVATDAIGMGLNLPIKRLFFSTLKKYNGSFVDDLTTAEILQIAGRAGRYGIHDNGYVGLLQNKVTTVDMVHTLENELNSTVCSDWRNMYIAPSIAQVKLISKTLRTTDFNQIFEYFKALHYGDMYAPIDTDALCNIYNSTKTELKLLPVEQQYRLLLAPIDQNSSSLIAYYKNLIKCIKVNKPIYYDFDGYHDLESAELENKKLTLFTWLSFYFDIFRTKNLSDLKNRISEDILEALRYEKHYGFSQMLSPRELHFDRDRNYYEDCPDFE